MPPNVNAVNKYNVGIRYEPLDALASSSDGSFLDGNTLNDSMPRTKHWAIVFTPDTVSETTPAFRIELKRCTNDQNEFNLTALPLVTHRSYTLGSWSGSMQNIMDLMTKHPMKVNPYPYSAWYNNCQHWAATMLLMLDALYKEISGRIFHISDYDRYWKILAILGKDGTTHRYNKPNPWFRGARATGVTLGGITTVGLVSLSTGTAAVTMPLTLPAAGLAGFFGATVTESVVVGTTMTGVATAAAIAVPLVGAGVIIGGIVAAVKASDWKSRTRFRNPGE